MPLPKDYSSPVRMSAKEKAFNQIQHWIIDGTLEPGEKLYDSEISEVLGVSRTPVREALLLLQTQGFVEMHPGKTTIVTPITKNDVLKIYPPLASLHSLAAEIAAEKISTEQIEKLKEINKRYEEAIMNEQPFKSMEIDEQFHNYIIDISENPYVSDFSSLLQLHIRRFKYVFLKQRISLKKDSIKEHEQLIEAFSNHNKEEAARVMKQNWVRPMNEVYKILDLNQ